MSDDGTCPACGESVDTPPADAGTDRAPWHFKLLVASVVIYLGWRAAQLIGQI